MIRYKGFECDTAEEAVSLMRALDGVASSAGDGGWIPWNGGECPVPNGTLIQTVLREESFDSFNPCINEAWEYVWLHQNKPFDIVAYRVVK